MSLCLNTYIYYTTDKGAWIFVFYFFLQAYLLKKDHKTLKFVTLYWRFFAQQQGQSHSFILLLLFESKIHESWLVQLFIIKKKKKNACPNLQIFKCFCIWESYWLSYKKDINQKYLVVNYDTTHCLYYIIYIYKFSFERVIFLSFETWFCIVSSNHILLLLLALWLWLWLLFACTILQSDDSQKDRQIFFWECKNKRQFYGKFTINLIKKIPAENVNSLILAHILIYRGK